MAKMPEIVAIAWATGRTVAQVTGVETVADRAEYSAPVAGDSGMERIRDALLYVLELDEYLHDQAIPSGL
jgi:hypothetical protein